MFQNIVAAISPSSACEPAVDKAIAFAQRFESHLSFIYVVRSPGSGWGSLEHHTCELEDLDTIRQVFEEHYREKLLGVDSYEINILPGEPHTEILHGAAQKEADLIIMGPHTRDIDLSQAKMPDQAGSCLQRVSQKARCPVMIVSNPEPHGEQFFTSILIATDFSAPSRHAVSYGSQLAKQYQAALHLVHIMDLSVHYPWSLPPQADICAYLDEAKNMMQSRYKEILKGVSEYHIEACEGIPTIEILKLSRLKKADMIIMAHHSKEEDPERAFLGSTVAQVAIHSTCPTVSINRATSRALRNH